MVVYRNVFDPDSETVLFGEESLHNFIAFMLDHNDGKNICIAHNGSGYDTRLVLEEISAYGINVKTSTTSNGTKMMELRANNTIFRDSLLHLPGSIAGLAKAFDLNIRKGTFPHLFNQPANYNYVGEIPDREFFDLTFTARSEKDITDFNTWYDVRKQTPWNFMEELTNYCKDDVKILAEIVLKHNEICEDKFGLSPWFSSTAPSYCHKVIKAQLSNDEVLEIPDDEMFRAAKIDDLAWNSHWGILKHQEYWHARKALIGGRTDVRRIHYRLSPDDIAKGISIKYQDIVSMYPYVQSRKNIFYPVGLPRIKIYDDKYYPCTKHQAPAEGNKFVLCDCSRRDKFADRLIDVEEVFTQPTLAYMSDFDTFGIATVSMTPPKDLFHPVLVVWDAVTGKRTATLEEIIEQTFTTVEIQLAIHKGYILNKVHRLDLYNKRPALWGDFVKDLYIEKLANSSPPPSFEEGERLAAAYEEDFGIGQKVKESFPRWSYKSALRLVFKIMLNSGWGKHCQRPNMGSLSFIDDEDNTAMTRLFSNVDNKNMRITNVTNQGNKVVYHTKPIGESPLPHDTYLPAGLFVPAYGRIMLYEALNTLGSRVLYHDTDSVIYIHDPAKDNIPQGDIWGEWDEEDVSKNKNITAFVGLGAKSYALETKNGKDVMKLKGLSIRKAHNITFKFLEDMVLNRTETAIPQRNFVYRMGEGISIRESLKKLCFDPTTLKGNLHGTIVYPPGYLH